MSRAKLSTSTLPSGDATGSAQFGPLLRQWRLTRRMSQLDLALEADVSAKHVSFLETGRSHPSREMVLRLAEVLDVPVRQRNTLLRAGGYASFYRESHWDDPQLAEIRRSIELMVASHDPFPAVVCDHSYNVHLQNKSSMALVQHTLPAELLEQVGDGPLNFAALLFHPLGFRKVIVNWREVGSAMIQRMHREVALRGDAESQALLDKILQEPDIPAEWRYPDLESELQVVVPLHLRTDDLDLRFFTAITTLGTALDVTLRELIIETFLPADKATEEQLRKMVADEA